MARTIATGIAFFFVLVAIISVPAGLLGWFTLSKLGLPASIIVSFLTGFVIGTIKRAYFEDNITAGIVSLALIGFLQLFLTLNLLEVAAIYVLGYLIGRRLEVVEVHDPFHLH
ncbi:MAG: hypothetical protein SV186_04470 [Candidatus Nanohaloarchaea archaeon]|nr:hypothetical protein [Candidatus Nanohaloarchaea archaeon]